MTDNATVDCWGEPIPAPPIPKETVEENSPEEKEQGNPAPTEKGSWSERVKELAPSRELAERTPEEVRAAIEKSSEIAKEREHQKEVVRDAREQGITIDRNIPLNQAYEQAKAEVEQKQKVVVEAEGKTEQETIKLPILSKDKAAIPDTVLDDEPKDPQEVLALVIDTVGHDATCMQREPELTAAVLMLAQALNNISSEQLSHGGTVEKTMPNKETKQTTKKEKTPLKKKIVSIIFYGVLTCLLTAAILLILAAIGFEPALAVFGLSS